MTKRKILAWLQSCGLLHAKEAPEKQASSVKLAYPDQFPEFPPLPPQEIFSHRADYEKMLAKRKYAAPIGATSDTPLYSLYRIYEHVVLNHNIDLRNELERFWFNRWPVSDIPDPMDQAEPARYAVLSCIPGLLVESFNKRIKVGLHRDSPAIINEDQLEEMWARERVYESVPEWTKKVAPLPEILVIPHEGGAVLDGMDDVRASRQLKEKNILHWQPHIHFM